MYKSAKIRLLVTSLTLFSLLTFSYNSLFKTVSAAPAIHIVISEVQIRGSLSAEDEFIELYNPTNSAVDISGWSIQRETTGGVFNKKNMIDGASVPAHGFYLIANEDYDGPTTPDLEHASFSLSATGTTVFIVNDKILLTSGTELTIVDKLAIGVNAVDGETSNFPTMPADEASIERYPGASVSTDGNGEDSDNNSGDFALRAVSEPQNTVSTLEVPTSPTITPTFVVTPTANIASTPTLTATPTTELTLTPTLTLTPSVTPTLIPTATLTPTPEPTFTVTPTLEPTLTPTEVPSPTVTPTATPEPTATMTPSPTPILTPTPSPEPTMTSTPSPEPTATVTNTPTITLTPSPEPTLTMTTTPIPTLTPTLEPTTTLTPTLTLTPTTTPSVTPTLTPVPGTPPGILIARFNFPRSEPTECRLNFKKVHLLFSFLYLPQVSCK